MRGTSSGGGTSGGGTSGGRPSGGATPDRDVTITALPGASADEIASNGAAQLLSFTITDGGGGDLLDTQIEDITVAVSGDLDAAKLAFTLRGPAASSIDGVLDSGTVRFENAGIMVRDGTSANYAVNARFIDSTGLTEGQRIVVKLAPETDITLTTGSSQLAGQAEIDNGSGASVSITATTLAITEAPDSLISSQAFSDAPVVAAQDDFGNLDVDFTGDVALSHDGAGLLAGPTTVQADSGIARFDDLAYHAAIDGEMLQLTAISAGLSAAQTDPITADVVATRLVFTDPPSPSTVTDGEATALDQPIEITARDADGLLDTDYTDTVVLSIQSPGAGTGWVTATNDADTDPTTVSLSAVAGAIQAENPSLTYELDNPNADETFTIRAAVLNDLLTSADSEILTALALRVANNAPLASGVAEFIKSLNQPPVSVTAKADQIDLPDGLGEASLLSGNDTLQGSGSAELIYGNQGHDVLHGGAGLDTLYGGRGDDAIDGGTGNDVLEGNRGDDTLTGGAGADLFVLPGTRDFTDGLPPIMDRDVVTDYSAVEGDVIRGPLYSADSPFMVLGDSLILFAQDGSQVRLLGISSLDELIFA
ncbi:MAG: calcium-binding protein [Pseudomonadota bacterium]